MNRFTQHVPAYVDRRGPDGNDLPPDGFDFETTAELLAHPLVASHAHPLYHGRDVTFAYFAKSDNSLMMVGHHLGRSGGYWWVIGYLKDPNAVDLREWKSPKEGA